MRRRLLREQTRHDHSNLPQGVTFRMSKKSDVRLAVHIAAVCSMGAAAIHAVVTPPHWQEWWAAGLFFACLAAFQAVWAVVAFAAPRAGWVVVLAIPVNLGATVLWGISRFVGVPAGPAAGTTEAIGVAGLAATLLGILTALLATWALVPRVEHASLRKGWYVGVLTGAALAVTFVAVPGVVAGPQHSHQDGSHGEEAHHEGAVEEDGHRDDDHHGSDEQPAEEPSPAATTSDAPTAPAEAETGHLDEDHDTEPHSH